MIEALGLNQVERVKSSATKQLLRLVVWFSQWCSNTDIQHQHPVQFAIAHTEDCDTHVPPLRSSCEKEFLPVEDTDWMGGTLLQPDAEKPCSLTMPATELPPPSSIELLSRMKKKE